MVNDTNRKGNCTQSRKVVVARILGGLGNQLFAFAASRRLALINDAELLLDDVSGFKFDHTYQRSYQLDHFNIDCRKASSVERLEPCSRIRRYLKRYLNRYKPFQKRSYIKQEFTGFDGRLLETEVKKSTYIEGYWQSEKYFLDVAEIIRKDLTIKPPTDVTNEIIADKISNSVSVAVHVRFFDDFGAIGGNDAPLDYYSRAVAEIKKRVPHAHFFLFSDNPSLARSRMPLSDDILTIVDHNFGDANAYADLWLMTLCKHFIIANSTFSWWGAWLSKNANKVIIAPAFEMKKGKMSWGFDGLLPSQWIKL